MIVTHRNTAVSIVTVPVEQKMLTHEQRDELAFLSSGLAVAGSNMVLLLCT